MKEDLKIKVFEFDILKQMEGNPLKEIKENAVLFQYKDGSRLIISVTKDNPDFIQIYKTNSDVDRIVIEPVSSNVILVK